MVLESLALVALIKLAVIASAGFCGLRICRVTLRPVMPSSLRWVAVMSIETRVNFSVLSFHQRAAVFGVLYVHTNTLGRLTLPGRSRGCLNL